MRRSERIDLDRVDFRSPLQVGCLLSLMLPVLCAVSALVLSAFSSIVRGREPYWTSGCVTPDGGTLAMVGDEAALIDLGSGAIRVRRTGYFDDVICLADGGTYGLSGGGARSLTTGATVVSSLSGRPDAAVVDEKTFLVVDRPTRSSGSGTWRRNEWSGPLVLRLESIGVANVAPRSSSLGPDRMTGVGVGPIDAFATRFVRRLASGEALVVAGFSPSVQTIGGSGWADGRGRGMFRVDPFADTVTPFGEALGSEEASCLLGSAISRATADRDGTTVFAVCEEAPNRLRLLRIEPTRRTSARIASIDDARESTALVLSDAADRIAVATLPPGGSSGRVVAVDATSGTVTFTTESFGSRIVALEWLRDGSLVLATGSRTVQRRAGATGAVLWSTITPTP